MKKLQILLQLVVALPNDAISENDDDDDDDDDWYFMIWRNICNEMIEELIFMDEDYGSSTRNKKKKIRSFVAFLFCDRGKSRASAD